MNSMWLKIEHIDKAPWKIIISTYRFMWWDKSFSSQDVCPWIVETKVGCFHYYDDDIAIAAENLIKMTVDLGSWHWNLGLNPITCHNKKRCLLPSICLYPPFDANDFWKRHEHIHGVFDILPKLSFIQAAWLCCHFCCRTVDSQGTI